jgi:TfoX/Sxy family transcriptional regulator of competence genes
VAYDEGLAERIRELLALREGVTERKMFGGIAWMLAGNMACGVIGDELIVRVTAEDREQALAEPHTREFDFTGRPMRGFVCVTAEGTEADDELEGWVDAGAQYAASLPAK